MKDPFERIIGYEDVKRDLRIISDMMNNLELYKDMGTSMENGLLLYGKPGTGKTTLANCLIESTEWKCYTCRKKSSDGAFVDIIVRTFEEARENAPAIVFLDDIDKFSDKPEEYEAPEEFVAIQTCMDELADEDVFVVATANNEDRLPDSLLRPGRFGRQIYVRTPRKEETVKIVEHYLGVAKTEKDLDPVSIAMMLQGESCAILEDVIRLSAVKATYNRQESINMDNIVDACLDLVFEATEFNMPYSDTTIRMAAYHEGGHALVAELLDPGCVSLASIRPTGGDALGLVRYCRKEAEEVTFDDYENALKTSLAGRAATEIVFGEPDLGANNDLHNAFRRAKYLVDNTCSYGFQNWLEDSESAYAAENRNRAMAMVMETNYMAVKRVLIKNRPILDRLAEELYNKSTLVHADIERIMKDHVK